MKLFLITLVALVPFLATAQDKALDLEKLKHPVHPALWKIEGKDLAKPSYLFGTMHVGDPRVTTLHPAAEKAFKASDIVYAEIDLDPKKQIAQTAHLIRKDGKTLNESIGSELSKELNDALKVINPVLDSQSFQSFKTWVASSSLPMLELQMKGKLALDQVIYQRAIADKKKVAGLETFDSQLKLFDSFTEKEQISMMRSTLKSFREDRAKGQSSTEKLINTYLAGNIDDLAELMKEFIKMGMEDDKALTERFMKEFLDDRNISMTETIVGHLSEQPELSHFFAVGAAHYTGKTAMQDLLSKRGYTVTPLFKQ